MPQPFSRNSPSEFWKCSKTYAQRKIDARKLTLLAGVLCLPIHRSKGSADGGRTGFVPADAPEAEDAPGGDRDDGLLHLSPAASTLTPHSPVSTQRPEKPIKKT